MRRLMILIAVLLSLDVFSQTDNPYLDTVLTIGHVTVVVDYTPQPKPKPIVRLPIDTISNPYEKKIVTNKLYISEICETAFISTSRCYVTSDSFFNEFKTEFEIDFHSNPKEIKFSSTNFVVNLKEQNYLFFLDEQKETEDMINFPISEWDSVKVYETGDDFYINLWYIGRQVKFIDIYFKEITEKSYKNAYTWWNTLSDFEKKSYGIKDDEKYEVLKLWIDKTFLNSLNKSIQTKHYFKYYLDNLLRTKGFVFTYLNKSFRYTFDTSNPENIIWGE